MTGDDATTEKGKVLEEAKLMSLFRYASSHLCRDFGDGKQSDVRNVPAGGTESEGGRASSGDAEMDQIIELLAAAGMALPC